MAEVNMTNVASSLGRNPLLAS